MSTLYVLSTPISGDYTHCSDLAYQHILNADFVIGEERKNSIRLLVAASSRDKELYLLNEHSTDLDRSELVDRVLSADNVAIFTDAGTPSLSDPDYRFIALCRENNIVVRSIGATSSITAAISISGIDCSKFRFASFPPADTKSRKNFFNKLKDQNEATIFMERPYSLKKVLAELSDFKFKIFLGINLTSANEISIYGKAIDILKTIEIIKAPFIIIVPKK